MGSLGDFASSARLALSGTYAALKTDAKRMTATLDEACQWGSTPDGGMSMYGRRQKGGTDDVAMEEQSADV